MNTKRAFFLVVMILITVAGVYASDSPKAIMDLNFSLGRQYLYYKSDASTVSRTAVGPGVGIDYSFVLKPDSTSFGFGTSFEVYDYSGFHKFYNLKVFTNVKQHVLRRGGVDFDLTGAIGADLVLRDDKDFGAYFLGRLGLDVVLRGTDFFDVVVHTNVETTIESQSWVYHLNGSAGLRFKF